jgi:mannose-6-phosphate isomerase-like protein (cupin superfamily)
LADRISNVGGYSANLCFAADGVDVLAITSVDIAGNSEGQDGVREDVTARLFSEGVPAGETPAARKVREAIGGENDGASREWARYVKRVAERHVEHLDLWVMLRQDRVARGSDQLSFTRVGFPAVRLSETHEHYDRQHQNVRVENGRAYGDDLAHFDAAYTAKLKGEFTWHHHEDEDEMFLVLRGSLTIRFREEDVVLGEGEFLVIPRGVEHMPVAEEDVDVMLFEPATTLNTGNVRNEFTIEEPQRG